MEKEPKMNRDWCAVTLTDLTDVIKTARTATEWQGVVEKLVECAAFARKAKAACAKAEAL